MFVSIYLLYIFIVFGVLYLLIKNISKHVRLMTALYRLPGPPTLHPIFGNVYALYKDREHLLRMMEKMSAKYFPLYKVWGFHRGAVVIVNPQDFEAILTNMKHHTKSIIYDLLTTWLNTGLLTSSGAKWQQRRKILTPSFHFNILQNYLKVFNEETAQLVEALQKECNPKKRQKVASIDVTELITGFTLKTMGQTAMGTALDTGSTMEKDYKKTLWTIADLYIKRVLRPWLYERKLYYFTGNYWREVFAVQKLHRFTRHIIDQRKKSLSSEKFLGQPTDLNKNAKRKMAMLDLLLASPNAIDEEGIREEVDTFMFEGHDTTALAITYGLMLIANHPQIQQKLVEEIQQVFGTLQFTEEPTIQQLQNLTYMEMTIKEVLRLYPSVWFISRVLGEDLVTHSGHFLPKDTIVVLHIRGLHLNSEIYPEPDRFDPERFNEGNCDRRHKFAYVPFSAGSRNCIGKRFAMLEIKALLVGLLRNFVLKPIDTPETVRNVADAVLRSVDSVRVEFEHRH